MSLILIKKKQQGPSVISRGSVLGILNTSSNVPHCTGAAGVYKWGPIIWALMGNIGEINWVGMGDIKGSVRRAFLADKTAAIMISWQQMRETERFLGLGCFQCKPPPPPPFSLPLPLSLSLSLFSSLFFTFPMQNKY